MLVYMTGDFLYMIYKNKDGKFNIPALITLGAQYDKLLLWDSINVGTNPLVNKPGFASEVAKLNSANLDKRFQPLTGNKLGKVRTTIIYSNNLDTMESYWAQRTTVSPRFPDGEIKVTKNGYAMNVTGIGDGTVPKKSAVYGSDYGKRWTEIPIDYGKKGVHANMVNKVDELLLNNIFTNDNNRPVKFDNYTIEQVKKQAKEGKVQASSLFVDEAEDMIPYLIINSIGVARTNLVDPNNHKTGIDFLSNNSINQIVDSEYNEYEGQVGYIIANPNIGEYVFNLSSNNLGKEYITFEYFDGVIIHTNSVEVAIDGDKSFGFGIAADEMVLASLPKLITAKDAGKTALQWDSVNAAVSYNVYSENEFTGVFGFIANVTDNYYLSNSNWNDTTNKLWYYVEPVFADDSTGILSISRPNRDYAIADFSVDAELINAGESVKFTDNSLGNTTTWEWDLNGDGIIV